MKKYLCLCWLVIGGFLLSCSSLETLTFDQLYPADVSFPEQVRNVGVVNNMPSSSRSKTNMVWEGDGKIAAETLAGALADSHYFNQVIICDSALQAEPLSQDQVCRLSEMLGVDMIFSFERLLLETRRGEVFYPELGVSFPMVSTRLTPVVQVYVPSREKPLFTISKKDSLYWHDDGLVTEKSVLEESSVYAATMLADYLVPHWRPASRFYYTGGCIEMRDAAVYVGEKDWNGARELWEKLYNRLKKGNLKVKSAFNIAVSFEMTGDIDHAISWLEKASLLVASGSEMEHTIEVYSMMLKDRKKDLMQLNIQMKRFD